MRKTLSLLSLAALLATGTATATMAAGTGADQGSSQEVTGVTTGSQQVPHPTTGSASTATSNQYGQSYPGQIGPTGSRQPDATNPARSNPSGGGGTNDSGGGSGGGAGGGSR